jgi:hypothetical protein
MENWVLSVICSVNEILSPRLDSIDATKVVNGSETVNVIFASSKIFNWEPLSWETLIIDGLPKYKS